MRIFVHHLMGETSFSFEHWQKNKEVNVGQMFNNKFTPGLDVKNFESKWNEITSLHDYTLGMHSNKKAIPNSLSKLKSYP